jgi:NAD(P)H-hydrate repair Nnr-like enzyme with NAD(P)H-hydrate epimerase domain
MEIPKNAEHVVQMDVPSGKHTKNNRTSPFFMGKLTISMAIFNSYLKLPEGKPKP